MSVFENLLHFRTDLISSSFFENSNKPEIGDFVLLYTIENFGDQYNDFINNNIGEIISVNTNQYSKKILFEVRYRVGTYDEFNDMKNYFRYISFDFEKKLSKVANIIYENKSDILIFLICPLSHFISIFLFSLASCKLFREIQTEKSDSTSVNKSSEGLQKVDTSKIKSESASTKETVYYPQPIYIQGKDGETKVVFVPQSTKETEARKEETDLALFENFRKEFLDSLSSKTSKKDAETKVKVLDFWQILALGLLFVVLIFIIRKNIKL